MNHLFRIVLTVIFLTVAGTAIASESDTVRAIPAAGQTPAKQVNNPAIWINDCYNRLNDIYLAQTEIHLDTVDLLKSILDHSRMLTLLMKDFYPHAATLNLRGVYNLKMRVADIVSDISKRQAKIHEVNTKLAGEAKEILVIRSEINAFNTEADTLFRGTFSETIRQLSVRQQSGEKMILAQLKTYTALENQTIELKSQARTLLTDLKTQLKKQEARLIVRELPPVWNSPPSAYPSGIGDVLAASFRQTIDSVKYYAEMSLWRIVIFRGLILILCLIPIRIFANRQQKEKMLESTSMTFLPHFPKTASLVMGLAFAPVVFVHPPHAFMEFILIGLVFTVTMVTFKIYPKLDKGILSLVMAAFLVLYLINFFVTPTFIGRLIYTLSVFLLIPYYLLFRRLKSYELRFEKTVRFLLVFLALHVTIGWVFVVLGHYTLGRSVILAAYSVVIIAMIMRIAVHTLLDYIVMIIFFINRNSTRLTINAAFLRKKLMPLFFLASLLFIVIAYLFTLSIFELLKSSVLEMLDAPREVGSAVFTFRSILLFFGWVYLAYLIASTLRYLVEPKLSGTARWRSHTGSFMLLLRMLILCAGIVLGILASGLPLSQFTVFMGALGVGIGFGLQSIAANLISGLVIAVERPFVVGDVIDVGEESGRVKEIGIRATMITSGERADILIPNSSLLSEKIKNWTVSDFERFIEFSIRTSMEANPHEVMEAIGHCLDRQDHIFREKSRVLFSDVADSCFVFTIKYLIRDLSKAKTIKSQLLLSIHKTFAERGIRFCERFRD